MSKLVLTPKSMTSTSGDIADWRWRGRRAVRMMHILHWGYGDITMWGERMEMSIAGKVISMFRLAQFHHKFNSSKEAIKFSESAKKLALDIFDYRNALSVIHFLSKIDT